jgi:hypothetical protein
MSILLYGEKKLEDRFAQLAFTIHNSLLRTYLYSYTVKFYLYMWIYLDPDHRHAYRQNPRKRDFAP